MTNSDPRFSAGSASVPLPHSDLLSATVSCSGLEITIQCNDHGVKDRLMDFLTGDAAQPTRLTDQELRKLWRDAGGEFYGPRVETWSMPEAKLLPFLRASPPNHRRPLRSRR
jgi:hypothetical protein